MATICSTVVAWKPWVRKSSIATGDLGPGRRALPLPRCHRGNDGLADLRAAAIVSSALACVDAATTAWVTGGGTRPLTERYDEAVAAVRGIPR